MSHYAIGDVQGCYSELMALLNKIQFNEHDDTLWFVGDIINGGSENLAVLRFISQLPSKTVVTLGNHDLHFLGVYYDVREYQPKDTFQDILQAPDVEILVHWLKSQSLMYIDEIFSCIMVHAGIYPTWSLTAAKQYAEEIESCLRSEEPLFIKTFLLAIFGIQDDALSQRWREHVNILTRMRFFDNNGQLNLTYKGTIQAAPLGLIPWMQFERHVSWKNKDVLFGHWSALEGRVKEPHFYALDTGCVWGGTLSALRLEDKQLFQVNSNKVK